MIGNNTHNFKKWIHFKQNPWTTYQERASKSRYWLENGHHQANFSLAAMVAHGIKNLKEKKPQEGRVPRSRRIETLLDTWNRDLVSSRSAAEGILSEKSSGRRRIRPDTELEIQEEIKVNNNDELWLSERGYRHVIESSSSSSCLPEVKIMHRTKCRMSVKCK